MQFNYTNYFLDSCRATDGGNFHQTFCLGALCPELELFHLQLKLSNQYP